MSEKIYACLLRLFPSAFRRLYGEEALRLLRDRLRDEVGFLPRLRLILNLISDIFRALPQAYSNSYAEAAPAFPFTSHVEGAPTFQALPTEPIRPAAIAFASVLTLIALAIVSFLMGRPTPYLPAAQNEPKSPIESVVERLNQTISPDSGASAAPNVIESTSVQAGRSETRPLYKANSVHSSETKSVATEVSKPPQSGERNVNENYSDSKSSPPAATSSSLVDGHPAQSELTHSATLSNTQPSTHATTVANVSGVWTAKTGAGGGDLNLPEWFVFKEYSAKLAGTGGPDSTEQYLIVHGLVTDDSVRFELNDGNRTLLYDLRFEDKGLQGTLSIKRAGKFRAVNVSLERVQ